MWLLGWWRLMFDERPGSLTAKAGMLGRAMDNGLSVIFVVHDALDSSFYLLFSWNCRSGREWSEKLLRKLPFVTSLVVAISFA